MLVTLSCTAGQWLTGGLQPLVKVGCRSEVCPEQQPVVWQIMGYSLAGFEHMFSVVTYPAPGLASPDASRSDKACALASMPFALGPRWLAHAANQGMQAAAGCVEAQSVGSTTTSAAVCFACL